MSPRNTVAVVVVSQHREDAEAVSKTLRNAGTAAHCTWVGNPTALPEAVPVADPELLYVLVSAGSEALQASVAYRDARVPDMPVLVLGDKIDEETIAAALSSGAQDQVSLGAIGRFLAVSMRELKGCRNARELRVARQVAEDYQRRVESMVKQSADALIYAQEGIILGVNPAALELHGFGDEGDLTGTPVMDLFEEDSHAAIKGALNACANGKWTGHTIRSRTLCSDGSSLAVELRLEEDCYNGDVCVRLELNPAMAREREIEARLVETTSNDPLTSFFYRRNFFDSMEAGLAAEPKGGVLALAHIRPDRIEDLHDRVGPILTDRCMLDIARMLQAQVKPGDILGQLSGGGFLVLMARGNPRDVRAWAEHLRSKVATHVFEAGKESLTLTCSVGIAIVDRSKDDFNSLFSAARTASGRAAEGGGDRVQVRSMDSTGKVRIMDDSRAVASIKAALHSNAFRLVYQPIASLQQRSCDMYDVLVRMLDASSREILPAQFLPAAQRNGLMRAIDRWVLANAAKACKEQKQMRLFVRLSNESLPDSTLVPWLKQQIKKLAIDPAQLIIQVPETDAATHIKETQELARQLSAAGSGFAIEHFGVESSPLQIIEHIPMDFLKIDGSLMQSLADDTEIQERVGLFLEAANAKNVRIIAERVEDANTMAVLYQLGVELIQGYYVQGPEVVLSA